MIRSELDQKTIEIINRHISKMTEKQLNETLFFVQELVAKANVREDDSRTQ